MRRVLTDLWTIITQSVREMDDPNQRVLWMLGVVMVCFIVVLSLTALLTGFVENLVEMICNVITTSVVGEVPKIK